MGGGLQGHGEHDHVELLAHGLAFLGHVFHQRAVAVRAGAQGVGTGAQGADALGLGLGVILLEVLVVRPHVHEEDRLVMVAMGVVRGDQGLLEGVHAAHVGAVGVVALVDGARAHALDPGDAPGRRLVRGAHHMALAGAGRGQEPFELHAGDHVGQAGVGVGVVGRGVEKGQPRCQDDRADLDRAFVALVFEIDGVRRARGLACPAFALLQVDAVLFVQGVLEGHCLVVEDEGGLALVQACVEDVVHLPGALARAFATGDALGRIHVAGPLVQPDRKIPFLAVNAQNVREGHQLNVQVPTALDQLG